MLVCTICKDREQRHARCGSRNDHLGQSIELADLAWAFTLAHGPLCRQGIRAQLSEISEHVAFR
jgi:hypothetical protein